MVVSATVLVEKTTETNAESVATSTSKLSAVPAHSRVGSSGTSTAPSAGDRRIGASGGAVAATVVKLETAEKSLVPLEFEALTRQASNLVVCSPDLESLCNSMKRQVGLAQDCRLGPMRLGVSLGVPGEILPGSTAAGFRVLTDSQPGGLEVTAYVSVVG